MKIKSCFQPVLLVLGSLVLHATATAEYTEEQKRLGQLPWYILRQLATDRGGYIAGYYYKEEQELTKVPNDIPAEAIRVSLENNQIREVPAGIFSHLPLLANLSLFGNKIEQVKADMWQGLENLQILDLQSNDIDDHIDCGAFQHLSSLTFLNLAMNKITHIKGCWWEGLGSLSKGLQLGDNNIAAIRGDMWVGLDSLVFLALWKNEITELPSRAFANLESIRVIDLGRNKLSTVPEDSFDIADFRETNRYPTRLNLFLSGNPLQCDNRMCWIKQRETSGSIRVDFASAQPECVNYPDTPWKNITLCNLETIEAIETIETIILEK